MNPDTAALGALAQMVFGETSPLYQDLVLKEQKVVLLACEPGTNRDPGLFQIIVRVRKPEDLAYVRERIAAALAEAAEMPIDPARLSAIKSHLRYEFAGSLDSADAVAGAVGEAIAVTGRPESINDLFDAYDRLTATDLQRVAADTFSRAMRRRSSWKRRSRNDELTASQRRIQATALPVAAGFRSRS